MTDYPQVLLTTKVDKSFGYFTRAIWYVVAVATTYLNSHMVDGEKVAWYPATIPTYS